MNYHGIIALETAAREVMQRLDLVSGQIGSAPLEREFLDKGKAFRNACNPVFLQDNLKAELIMLDLWRIRDRSHGGEFIGTFRGNYARLLEYFGAAPLTAFHYDGEE